MGRSKVRSDGDSSALETGSGILDVDVVSLVFRATVATDLADHDVAPIAVELGSVNDDLSFFGLGDAVQHTLDGLLVGSERQLVVEGLEVTSVDDVVDEVNRCLR